MYIHATLKWEILHEYSLPCLVSHIFLQLVFNSGNLITLPRVHFDAIDSKSISKFEGVKVPGEKNRTGPPDIEHILYMYRVSSHR